MQNIRNITYLEIYYAFILPDSLTYVVSECGHIFYVFSVYL